MNELDFDELDRAVSSLMNNAPNAAAVVAPTLPKNDVDALDAAMPTQPSPAAAPVSSVPTPMPSAPVAPAPMSPAAPVAPRGKFMDIVRPSVDPKPQVQPAPARPVAAMQVASPRPVVTMEASSAPMTANVDVPTQAQPLSTPFLPDTKVEKRPLGGSGPAPSQLPVGAVEPSSQPMPASAPLDMPLATPLSNEAPSAPAGSIASAEDQQTHPGVVPEELGNDLLAIESGSHFSQQIADAPVTSPMAGVVSIAQQYREAPSEGAPTSGAIYDTSQYHQPLMHPAQKTPGWVWIVAIVSVLLVGAGLGALVYFVKF